MILIHLEKTMKFTILQENFKTAVNLASHFITNKVQLPILGNIYIKTDKTSVNLQATNLENSVSITIAAKIEKEGEITVNGKTLNDIVSNLGSGNLEIEVEKEQVIINKDKFKSKILGVNSSDFPKTPAFSTKNTFSIDLEDFNKSLSKTIFSVSNDETRPILTGVLLVNSKDGCFLVSTDGFRLTEVNLNLSDDLEDFKIVIPKAILNELVKTNESGKVNIFIDKENNQILFNLENITFSSRLIEGEFPDYKKIIPSTNIGEVIVEKEEFEKAIKLASVFARDGGNIVKLKVEENQLAVVAESSTAGNQETQIEAKIKDFEKKDFEIMFNFRFIEEAIKVIESDEVQIQFSENSKATKFLDTKNKKFLHIIMPIKS